MSKSRFSKTQAVNHQVWSNPYHFIAFGFGSGLSKYAPGTLGTLVAIPIYLLMASMFNDLTFVWITIAFFIIGVPICDKVSNDLNVHDFSGIVWDEVVGFLITMAFIPLSWDFILLGFILFRLFDILKPWPISYLDKKITGGLGIMLDDVLAGIFAWAVLMLISNYWLTTPLFPI